MLEIKILGSPCATSDYYLDLVEKTAAELGVEFTAVKIEDEAIINSYGVFVNCLFGYCPGCHRNNLDNDEMNVPAMVINEEVVFHSVVPSGKEITETLKKISG